MSQSEDRAVSNLSRSDPFHLLPRVPVYLPTPPCTGSGASAVRPPFQTPGSPPPGENPTFRAMSRWSFTSLSRMGLIRSEGPSVMVKIPFTSSLMPILPYTVPRWWNSMIRAEMP